MLGVVPADVLHVLRRHCDPGVPGGVQGPVQVYMLRPSRVELRRDG